jgi:hypothetical protein
VTIQRRFSMLRKIFYKGLSINDDELVVGNHGPVQIVINGNFCISGLVHCPKYHIEILVNGSGTISLHGTCKAIVLKKVLGDCTFDLQDALVGEVIIPPFIKGKNIFKVSKAKIINENFLGENILIIRKPSKRSNQVMVNEDIS